MDECLGAGKLKGAHLVFIILFVASHAHSLTDNSSTIIEKGKGVVKDFYRRFSGKEVDLVFILDRSASIPPQGWSSMITFIRSLLEHFSVTGDHTRVAIITYSSHVSMEINDLNEIHTTKCSLMQQIKQRLGRKIPSGYTATYEALKKAQSILLNSRRNAKKSVFVLTDGRSNVGMNPVRASLEIRSLRWNSTWNTSAFGPQVEIYAFGIKDAHLPELKSIASQLSNHTFFIPDFKTFANLARQLHNDSQLEEWEIAGRKSLCNNTCSKHAVCACGTRIGQYQCICNAGYEGDGIKCKLCEKGFYKDSLSPGRCNPCPANSTTNYAGSEHIRDCSCHTPYYRDSPNDPCQLRECSTLPQIDDGFSFHVEGRMTDEIANTGIPCKNTPGDSCHYECKLGFRLTSNPVLVCETNGSWSGVVPKCKIVDCKSLSEVGEDVSHGQDVYINSSTTYGSFVEVSCMAGWQPFGDTVRKCNRHGVWSGTRTWCVEAKCKPLSEINGGDILPSLCTETTLNPGKLCHYKCKPGYRLIGPSKRMCGNHGQWNTSDESRCVDVEAPSLRCPADMEVSIGTEGFATVYWRNEKPDFSDNSGYAKLTYYGLNKSPAQLKIGYHQVEYVVKDNAHNNASCVQKIKVLKDIVKVLFCPENITITDVEGYKVPVSWSSPVFVNKDNTTVQHECTHTNGNKMAIGHHNVLCSPLKNFGSGIRCRFSVNLKRKTCVRPRPPKNGAVSCQESEMYLQMCTVSCNMKYDFATVPHDMYLCKLNGEWSDRWPDCSFEHIPGSAAMSGKIEYYYYIGQCHVAKKKIAKVFHDKLQSEMKHHCRNLVCSVEDIEVVCDNSTQRRRRRNIIPLDTQSEKGFHRDKRDANQQRMLTVRFKIKMEDNITTGNQQYLLRRKLGTVRNEISKDQIMDITIDSSTGIGNISVKNYDLGNVKIEADCAKKGMVTSKKMHVKCLNCPIGFYYTNNNTCEKCPVGFYQDVEGQTSCNKCPESTSTLTVQSKDKSDCRAFCKPGTYSIDGFAPCEDCEISTYQDKFNSTSCIPCPHNRVTSKQGATNRSDCSIPCPPGSYNYNTGLQPCELCPKDTYQPNKGATECYYCPSNSKSNTTGTKSSDDCLYEDHCKTNTTSRQLICLNGGSCHNNFENFTCECADGFAGRHCEININECEGQVCHNNGICQDGINHFTCKCKPGYTGLLCDQEINECESSPCQNGGSCEDRFNKFKCYCPQQYTGKLCEKRIDLCSPSPCKKRGTCTNMDYGYKCRCHPGFTGVNCSVVIDQCISLPCMNGGTCQPKLNTFSCTCPDGYVGKVCEKDVDECASNPCLNGGSCVNLRNDYHCLCAGGFGAKNCQNEISADFDLVFQRQSTTDYVHLMMFPNPEEISVCFWMRTLDVTSLGTMFSYSKESNQPFNTDTFTLYDYGNLQLFVNGQHIIIGVSLNDGLWHHVCTTWSSVQGEWHLYINGTETKYGRGLATGFKLPSGGDFLIGQDTHVLFGAANMIESFVGEISQFNVYNHVLAEMEIKSLGNLSKCNTAFGNVLAWSQVPLRTHGDVQIRNNSHCLDINECLFPVVFQCGQNKLCNDMVGGYECNKCKYGYTGPKCDESIDECKLGVCLNRAQCKDGPDPYDYTCFCTANFTGLNCADKLDPCPVPDPCYPYSSCVPSKNGHFCKNRGGSTDPGSLTINCKAMDPCENGGKCVSRRGKPDKCVCPPMWKGELCDISYKPNCDLSPCLNNGTCIQKPGSVLGYRCECPNDYYGTPVQYDSNCALKNPCDSNSCQNGGFCLQNTNGKYTCSCSAPYYGDFCEKGGSSSASSG